jgi:hypothetical protein
MGDAEVESITINDSRVEASGDLGAGIGSGCALNGTARVGSILIVNGQVTAAGTDAAAIGSGFSFEGRTEVNSLTIRNARVLVQGTQGAGIGSGLTRQGVTRVRQVRLQGGTVTASASHAAAIGSGLAEDGVSSVDEIIIEGTLVEAGTVIEGTGIGAGYGSRGNSTVGTLKIHSAAVSASGFGGAGIGSGTATGGGRSVVERIELRIDAARTTGFDGAGIGSGSGIEGSSIVQSLVVLNGSYTATAQNAAGIGSGFAQNERSVVSELVIVDGLYVLDVNDVAAGLGAGVGDLGVSTVTNLTVMSGSIFTKGKVGIGAAFLGEVDRLLLVNGTGSLYIDCHVSEWWCLSANSIGSGPGAVRAITDSMTFFDSEWPTCDFNKTEFFGMYRSQSLEDGFTNVRFLHFANTALDPEPFTLTFSLLANASLNYSRVVEYDTREAQGLLISLKEPGAYQVGVEFDGRFIDALCAPGEKSFRVAQGETFVEEVSFCVVPPTIETGISAGEWAGIAIGIAVVIFGLLVFIGLLWKQRDVKRKQSLHLVAGRTRREMLT